MAEPWCREDAVDQVARWLWHALSTRHPKRQFDEAVRRAEFDRDVRRQVIQVRAAARSALIAASRLPAATEGEFERIAKSQADTMNDQAVRIRELIRERDAAKDEAEGAYDLAEQYARRCGVDVARDDTLKYVGQYWELRGKIERTWKELEGLRWNVFQLLFDLREGLANGGVDEHTGRQVAENVIQWIAWAERDGPAKRRPEVFARPAAPGRPAGLFDAPGVA